MVPTQPTPSKRMPLDHYAHRPSADIERIIRRAMMRWLICRLQRWLRQMRCR